MPIKKKSKLSSQERLLRLEKAYADYCSGKKNSLKELAKKYKFHITDLSIFITMKFEQAREEKQQSKLKNI